MRRLALATCCALLCGCYPDLMALDDLLDVDVPDMPSTQPNRLAFVTAADGNVSCLILDFGESDPVVNVHDTPTGVATGVRGDIFIATDDEVIELDASWSFSEPLELGSDIVHVDGIGADAGSVVIAARTDDGAVIRVYDEGKSDVVAASAPVADTTIKSVAVADGKAFAIESPSGVIVSYDVTVAKPTRTPLDAVAGEPVAVVVGDTGNLFVADAATGDIEEIDVDTGEPLGMFFDGSPAMRPVGMAYDPDLRRYLLLTADDRILEIDRTGRIVETHESDLVRGATAIAFLGE